MSALFVSLLPVLRFSSPSRILIVPPSSVVSRDQLSAL
jgi:hypothetical protein